jgi:peptide chain release factor 2
MLISTTRDLFEEKSKLVKESLDTAMTKEDYEKLKLKYVSLNNQIQNENVWDDSVMGAQLSKEFSDVQKTVEFFDTMKHNFKNILDLYSMGEEEEDCQILAACVSDMEDMEVALRQRVLGRIMSNIEDDSACYAEIVAGVGGLDAYDWTRMLASMYANWASTEMAFSVKYVDEHVADGAPSGSSDIYRRLTLRFDGPKAYGYFKAEAGVHRLVRRSPYDPSDKRHTSFAQVQVYPAPPEDDRSGGSASASSFHVDMRYTRCRPFIVRYLYCCW